MRVIVANPRGFCAGVNMAIETVERVLALRGAPVYVYHEIVHNRHVVTDLASRGVIFVDDVAQVPAGAVLVYSAHGVSPAVRQQARALNLIQIDATCPLVSKVHGEVIRFARSGHTIIFIGHAGHDEALGTIGEAPEHVLLVQTVEDVAHLAVPDPEKVAYVTQTTLSVWEAQQIIAALKSRFPSIKAPPKEDICYATTNRQAAVRELALDADVVLVIGSQNSSNSRRLVETALASGISAHLIDDAAGLQPAWLRGKETVLVTAGASAPEPLVEALLERLRSEFDASVETRTVAQEDVSFELPRSLRSLAVVSR